MDDAKWRADHGEAPNEDAVRDWNRLERRRMAHIEATMRDDEQLKGPTSGYMLKTTAEQRPTAYIPEELGIPKPYGALAPFKPSDPGSTMRHIKPPQIKAIEI